MSHEQLAQMVGANRPHVSAIMSKFKKRGWIQYQRRKLLIDAKALSEFVGARAKIG
jgi:CRP-like cAMP-binding protein